MLNNTPNPNFQPRFKTIQIIHLALLLGQVVFGFVAFNAVQTDGTMHLNVDVSSNILYIVCLFLLVAGNTVSYFITSKLLNAVKEGDSLQAKFTSYQTALIIRFAMMEGANLFVLVVFMLTGNSLLLYVAIAVIAVMGLIRPTRTHFAEVAELSTTETREFEAM